MPRYATRTLAELRVFAREDVEFPFHQFGAVFSTAQSGWDEPRIARPVPSAFVTFNAANATAALNDAVNHCAIASSSVPFRRTAVPQWKAESSTNALPSF